MGAFVIFLVFALFDIVKSEPGLYNGHVTADDGPRIFPDGHDYGHTHHSHHDSHSHHVGHEHLKEPSPLNYGGDNHGHNLHEHSPHQHHTQTHDGGYGGTYFRKPNAIVGPTYDSRHGSLGLLKPLSVFPNQYGGGGHLPSHIVGGEGLRALDHHHHHEKEHETLGPLHLKAGGLYGKVHDTLGPLGHKSHDAAHYGLGAGGYGDLRLAEKAVGPLYGKSHGELYSKHASPLYAEGHALNHHHAGEGHGVLDHAVGKSLGGGSLYGKPHGGGSLHASPYYGEGHGVLDHVVGKSLGGGSLYGKSYGGGLHSLKHASPYYGEGHGVHPFSHLSEGPHYGSAYGEKAVGHGGGYNNLFAPIPSGKIPLAPIRELGVEAPIPPVYIVPKSPHKALHTIVVAEKPNFHHHDSLNHYAYGHGFSYPAKSVGPLHSHYPPRGVKLHGGSELSVTPSSSFGYSYKLVPESLRHHTPHGHQPFYSPYGRHSFDKVDKEVANVALNTATAIVSGGHGPHRHHHHY